MAAQYVSKGGGGEPGGDMKAAEECIEVLSSHERLASLHMRDWNASAAAWDSFLQRAIVLPLQSAIASPRNSKARFSHCAWAAAHLPALATWLRSRTFVADLEACTFEACTLMPSVADEQLAVWLAAPNNAAAVAALHITMHGEDDVTPDTWLPGPAAIFHALSSMRCLAYLALTRVGLTVQHLPLVAAVLQSVAVLETLDLSHNSFNTSTSGSPGVDVSQYHACSVSEGRKRTDTLRRDTASSGSSGGGATSSPRLGSAPLSPRTSPALPAHPTPPAHMRDGSARPQARRMGDVSSLSAASPPSSAGSAAPPSTARRSGGVHLVPASSPPAAAVYTTPTPPPSAGGATAALNTGRLGGGGSTSASPLSPSVTRPDHVRATSNVAPLLSPTHQELMRAVSPLRGDAPRASALSGRIATPSGTRASSPTRPHSMVPEWSRRVRGLRASEVFNLPPMLHDTQVHAHGIMFGAALAQPSCALVTLTCVSCGMTDDIAIPLLYAASKCATLRRLDLSRNNLAQGAAYAAAALVRSTQHLQVLQLGHQLLGSVGTLAIVDALQDNRTLWELGLENTAVYLDGPSTKHHGGHAGSASHPVEVRLQEADMWHRIDAALAERGAHCEVSFTFPPMPRRSMPAFNLFKPLIATGGAALSGFPDVLDSGDDMGFDSFFLGDEEAGGGSSTRSSGGSGGGLMARVRPWKLSTSHTWANRPKEADSGDWYDTPAFLERVFENDWAALHLQRLVPNPAERARIKAAIKPRFTLLRELFKHFASRGGNAFSVTLPQFIEFRRAIGLDSTSRTAELDMAFFATESSVQETPSADVFSPGAVLPVNADGSTAAPGQAAAPAGGSNTAPAAAVSGSAAAGGAGAQLGGGRPGANPDSLVLRARGSGNAGMPYVQNVVLRGEAAGGMLTPSALLRHEFLEAFIRLAITYFRPSHTAMMSATNAALEQRPAFSGVTGGGRMSPVTNAGTSSINSSNGFMVPSAAASAGWASTFGSVVAAAAAPAPLSGAPARPASSLTSAGSGASGGVSPTGGGALTDFSSSPTRAAAPLDAETAVKRALEDYLVPSAIEMLNLSVEYVGEPATNMFRRKHMYTEVVDATLKRLQPLTRRLFEKYADPTSQFLFLNSWMSMLTKVGAFDGTLERRCFDAPTVGGSQTGKDRAKLPSLTSATGGSTPSASGGGGGTPSAARQRFDEAAARLLFLNSIMTVLDETTRSQKRAAVSNHTSLTYTGFLEALCRLADARVCPARLPLPWANGRYIVGGAPPSSPMAGASRPGTRGAQPAASTARRSPPATQRAHSRVTARGAHDAE
ncbi:hypothetical protein EON62_00270, partial [archaeon]